MLLAALGLGIMVLAALAVSKKDKGTVEPLKLETKYFFASRFRDAAKGVPMQGIPIDMALAVAALETGWGTGRIFKATQNLFSITQGSWAGPIYVASSGIVYRRYPSWGDSIKDWVALMRSPRYQNAYQSALAGNFKKFFYDLQAVGYAGDDLSYALKLEKVMAGIA